MRKKGFTLIELLVVIAIIGILSSIVLIALRGARNKAKDARIMADLSQIRSLAEVLYDGNYDDLLTHADYLLLAGPTGDISTQMPAAGTIVDEQTGGAYCVSASLNMGGFWCVDSTGYSGSTVACDAATADCAAD